MAEHELSPEFALVAALEAISELQDKVSVLQPKKGVRPPFAFYVSDTDEEEQALDGGTGLMRYTATLHLVSETYLGLQLLCARAKAAILGMRKSTYSAPTVDGVDALDGRIFVEDAHMTQSSPDLYETEVGYYRRMCSVRIDFQTEEVISNDD